MNGLLQQLCDEAAEKATREAEYRKSVQIAQEMLAEGIEPSVVAKCTKLPLDAVLELAGKKTA